MCGRYALYTDTYEWSDLAVPWIFEEGFSWTASYNIAPSTTAPIVLNLDQPIIARCRWGLVPPWSKDPLAGNRMINARAETIGEKPVFREPFKKRRCVVLADGFFEWKKNGRIKIPIYVTTLKKRILGFAGLWENHRSAAGELIRTFTIITTRPNRLIAPIHDRMPVILSPDRFHDWLGPNPRQLNSLLSLLVPFPAEALHAFPVSGFVNNPANNSPECIKPAGDR
ncbi:MAG: SOS response-associated peptidase [Deltaproteobacteria bacterium]|nr:SOS response-associated peptidase [Deltaproteobacteria bacterium]